MNALAQIRPKLESAQTEQSDHAQLEAVGRLVSGVAHDFNNLLTGVVLCSDLLLAGLEKQSPLRRYAQEIRGAATHGADLIAQLLGIARQGEAGVTLVSFNQSIAGLQALLHRLMGEDIELIANLAHDLSEVRMDPAHAQQIILNLLLNSRDAMPDGGRITLTTRNLRSPEADSQIEFEVGDDGCGMDASTRAQALQPFFTTKASGVGTGLGLATVSRLVHENGGSLAIESDPGKGTRVTVRLPAQGKQAAACEDDPCTAAEFSPRSQMQKKGKQV